MAVTKVATKAATQAVTMNASKGLLQGFLGVLVALALMVAGGATIYLARKYDVKRPEASTEAFQACTPKQSVIDIGKQHLCFDKGNYANISNIFPRQLWCTISAGSNTILLYALRNNTGLIRNMPPNSTYTGLLQPWSMTIK